MLVKLTSGCNTLNYSICIGASTAPCLVEMPAKMNWTIVTTLILSIVFYIFVNIRSAPFFEKFIQNKLENGRKSQDIARIERNNLTDYISAGINLIVIVLGLLFGIVVAKITQEKANIYPHYIIVYFHHMVLPFFIINSMILLYYFRQPRLRKTIWRELKYQFNFV